MQRFLKKFSQKAGLPPGSLVHVGETIDGAIMIKGLRYTETEVEEFAVQDKHALLNLKEKEGVLWLQVDGVHHPQKIGLASSGCDQFHAQKRFRAYSR